MLWCWLDTLQSGRLDSVLRCAAETVEFCTVMVAASLIPPRVPSKCRKRTIRRPRGLQQSLKPSLQALKATQLQQHVYQLSVRQGFRKK